MTGKWCLAVATHLLYARFDLHRVVHNGYAALQKFQADLLSGEHIFEVERVMDALDDAGGWIYQGDTAAQLLSIAVTFGDENRVGSR